MFDIIAIGDATLDTHLIIDDATVSCDLKRENCKLCFNYADKIPIQEAHQSVGGNAANIAVGMKKLGLSTALVAELGDDIAGLTIQSELETAGVSTKFIAHNQKQKTRYSVVLNFKSERTILTYHAKYNYKLPKLPASAWLYYTSLGASFEKLQNQLAQYLKSNPDSQLACNPGSYQLKYAVATIKKILPFVDVLFVNKQEAATIIGAEKNQMETAKILHKFGVKTLVITDGCNGSYASDNSRAYSMSTYPIKPLAKTGAGDAYASGFMAAVLLKKNLPEAMRWGTANASGVIQKWGAQNGLFTKHQIQKQIARFRTITPRAQMPFS